MTDTNMTDTNTFAVDGGGVPQDCGKRVRVITTRRNDENRTSLLLVVVWFRGLLCSVWRNTSVVVLGVLVVIVAGSRPVVLFEPGC